MDAFDVIGLLLPAVEKVGNRIIGYNEQIRKKFNRALEKALSANDELYINNAKVHLAELIGLILLVMDEPSSINSILLPNYISRDEFRRFYAETEKDKDLCQVLKDEWNQYKAKDTNNIIKTTFKYVVERTGSMDEVKGLVEKLICSFEELNVKVGEIADKKGLKSGTSKIDDYNQLYKCLDEKLHDKRENHPSFQLMKIDDRLFPNAQTKQKHIKLEALDSNDKLKTVRDIIEESWEKGEKNHLMIEGDGGIGKTVTLLSIPDIDKFAPHYVPAIYIPLHEMTTGEDPIERYIKKKILKNKGDLYEQLLDLVDQPWDNGPRLLLLLDGFNEISVEQRVPIGKDIVYWSEFHGIQIITSSRYDIRTYVALGKNYSAIKLQPLSNATVKEYLRSMGIPAPTNEAIEKLITTPLMLTLYAMTERVLEERECDASDFREVKNAGSIVWNYLQCELWNFGKEGENAKNAIVAMEFIAPYMAWQMQQNTLFRLSKKKFHDFLKEAYQLLEKHFDKTEAFPFHISDAIQKSNGIPPLDLIRSLLENKLCLFVKNGNEYRLMHQQFRDALVAIHLINLSYLSGNSLPQEWNTPVDYYVMQFVVDLIGEEEATLLWEQNRKTTPANDDATRNQLRLQGLLHNNDFSHLDFSGIDLSDISLYPYRKNSAINLPIQSEKMFNTKLSDDTFSSRGHEDAVAAVAVTPDGKRIVSGSWDKTMCVWDLETGEPIGKPFKGHKSYVDAIAVTPDGKRIVSGSGDCTIRVWDLETSELIGKPFKGHESYVGAIALTPDGKHIISGSGDGTIRVWDLETGEPIGKPFKGHESHIDAVAVTPNGKRIVSGSGDGTIRVWDLETNELIGKPLKGHKSMVNAVAVTPDGKHIVSGSGDKTICVWDLETGEMIKEPIEGHKFKVDAVVVTPDGKRIVSGSGDCTIRVWDLETSELYEKPFEGHKYSVAAVAVTPDSKRIVSGSYDKTIRVWDIETSNLIGKPIEGHTFSMTAIAVTSKGKLIISGLEGNTIRVWDLMTGKQFGKSIEGHEVMVRAIVMTPDEKRIVCISWDNTIHLWDLKTGEQIGRHKYEVKAVTVTPDSKRIVSGFNEGIIQIKDLETGKPIGKPIKGHEGSVDAVAVTPDGKYIISGSSDKTIRIWDFETGKPIGKRIGWLSSSIDTLTVTPDGKRIISEYGDGTIEVWGLETSELIGKPFKRHKSYEDAIALTPDGKRIIIRKRQNNIIYICDFETGAPIGKPIELRRDNMNAVAVTSNGKHIVCWYGNGIISTIDIETRKIKTIHIHPLSFVGLDFSKAIFSTPELKEILRQNGAKVDPD